MAARLATCALVLLAVDAGVRRWLPDPDGGRDWRMPRERPTSEISIGMDAVASSVEPVTAFVGGSPAWGEAVSNGSDTVPAHYGLLAEKGGRDTTVINLACNGQLVGDSYFIAKKAADLGADTMIVQVTYHNFSPRGRDGATRRYPELASVLGVPVSRPAAGLLGCEPTPRLDVTGAADRMLRRTWRLYGQRDRVVTALFGEPPETRMRDAWLTATSSAPDAEQEITEVSFVDTDPGMQTVMADEWATDTAFTLSASDSEAAMLAMLCRELTVEGVQVTVYLAPVNLTGVSELGLLDAVRFKENTVRLGRIVERAGGRFVDLNAPAPLPPAVFADINHTTDEGCRLSALRLADACGSMEVQER